jgi:tRNA/rRNA methyltransferase
MSETLDNVVIVMVEPQSPGNIGMACRAMKNMGLSRLRLVKGCDRFHPESLKFAVSAKDLLEKAEIYSDLASALADCTISVGTTRRHGKYRQEILSPLETAVRIRDLSGNDRLAAIVFGREDSGLTTDELSLCRWHATIPTSQDYGSLNLSQAILLFCYELEKSEQSPGGGRIDPQATSGEMESMFCQMEETLQRIGFLNQQNPGHIMLTLRRMLYRANMDNREVSIIRGMMTQVDWACSGFDGRKNS